MANELNLKPCPFCASDELQVVDWIAAWAKDEHREYAVLCCNCDARGPNYLSEAGAVKMWNMRRSTELPLNLLMGES